MRISFQEKVTDPPYPFMAGKNPIAKEFNKRQAILWSKGAFDKVSFEQVATVLLEIFADEYDKNHKTGRKSKVKI